MVGFSSRQGWFQLQVYEALLRPFGGKIPKRVKTQVAAAAELGDVQAGRWPSNLHGWLCWRCSNVYLPKSPDYPPGEMGGKSPEKGGYVSFRGGKITCLGLVCLCFFNECTRDSPQKNWNRLGPLTKANNRINRSMTPMDELFLFPDSSTLGMLKCFRC